MGLLIGAADRDKGITDTSKQALPGDLPHEETDVIDIFVV
jgi:hypothetical protein